MFQLDPKSRKSIYEQVIDNLKELIMTGKLQAGEKLPSVRDLSKTITVNPNTVSKAYRELERQGYVYSQTGLGTFVSDTDEIAPGAKELETAKENLDESFKALLYLGIEYEEARKIAISIMDSRNPEGGKSDIPSNHKKEERRPDHD